MKDNILTYLKFRGDLSLEISPFNLVDNLILSTVAYFDLTNIVTDIDISLQDAMTMLLSSEELKVRLVNASSEYRTLATLLQKSERFNKAKLSHYVDLYDETEEIQFSAVQIWLSDGTNFVAFRGTDQTILGWREDFQMSYKHIAAQNKAAAYLSEIIIPTGVYRIGGHSKGGNLAVFGVSNLTNTQQNQIINIYDNDVPGFSSEIFNMGKINHIQHKLCKIVPEYSIIGQLFSEKDPDVIVKADGVGILQHNPMNWLVSHTEFMEVVHVSDDAKRLNEKINNWLSQVSLEEKEGFTKNLFDIFQKSGSKDITAITGQGVSGFERMVMALIDSESMMKTSIFKAIQLILPKLNLTTCMRFVKQKSIRRGFLTFFCGIIYMSLPSSGAEVFAISAVFILSIFLLSRIIYYLKKRPYWSKVSTYCIIFYSFILISLVSFSLSHNIFIHSVNFLIGIVCLIYAYQNLVKLFQLETITHFDYWLKLLRAIIFGLLSCVMMLTFKNDSYRYTLALGSFIMIDGMMEVIYETYKYYKRS